VTLKGSGVVTVNQTRDNTRRIWSILTVNTTAVEGGGGGNPESIPARTDLDASVDFNASNRTT
jgi:hypothetical protein